MWCDLAENRLDSGLFSFEISLPRLPLDPCAFHLPPCTPSLSSPPFPPLLPPPPSSYPLSPLSRQRTVPRNASKEITGRFISLCLGHESRIVSENWPSSVPSRFPRERAPCCTRTSYVTFTMRVASPISQDGSPSKFKEIKFATNEVANFFAGKKCGTMRLATSSPPPSISSVVDRALGVIVLNPVIRLDADN